jgi:hypothetical protein
VGGAAGGDDRGHAECPEGPVVEDHVTEVAVGPRGRRRCSDGEGEGSGAVARRVAGGGGDGELAGLAGRSVDQSGAPVGAEAVREAGGGEPYGLVGGPQEVPEVDSRVGERLVA